MVQLFIVQLSIWALLIADLPLIISVILIFWLLGHWVERALLLPFISESCRYTDSGNLVYAQRQQLIERIEISFATWFVVFVGQQGERQILWRDSCREQSYRQIVVLEKRRRYRPRLSLDS
ncbi:hypothetical protein [Vibrio mangrovi]|nr:hypothetical protein [Vibrio mangrovi]MDW6002945.1 hypothetical protein [Vibrio mangrovi]